MSAEAIARLREAETARRFEPPQRVMVHPDDLRALLDAHTEALDALRGLTTQPVAKAGWSKSWDDAMDEARAVLAKAGRR